MSRVCCTLNLLDSHLPRLVARQSLNNYTLYVRSRLIILSGDKAEFTCTIMTRDAVGPAAEIHTRMPIALPKDAEAAWLDPALTDAVAAVNLARERAVTEFVHHAVNPRVNNARNEGAELIEAFEDLV